MDQKYSYILPKYVRRESKKPVLLTYYPSSKKEVEYYEDVSIIDLGCDDIMNAVWTSSKQRQMDAWTNFLKMMEQYSDFPLERQFDHLSDREVHEWYSQELRWLFNMFHYDKIDAKELDAALKSWKEKYYDWRMDCHKCICRGDAAGTSLSRPSSLEGGGVPVGIGLVNNNGDPSSSVKHSPPGKGKVPHEEGAGGFANVSGDGTGSMNAPHEGDLEMGRVDNNNGDPPAPGDVPSSVVPHGGHTADRLGEYGVNVARTVFRVSAAVASRTTTSNFAKASYAIGLADSGAAILLADTHWKATTPILAKAGIVACGVGVLADIGKDLPLPLFTGAIIAAIFIIIAAMVFAKRLA